MKKSSQIRTKQEIKKNSKISSFFSTVTKPNISSGIQKLRDSVIVLSDSDDDFVDSRSSKTSDKENNSSKTSQSKKRKVNEISNNNPPHKRNNAPKITPPKQPFADEELKQCNVTPEKKISVRSPEYLLTPEALKQYHTPEKKQDKQKRRVRTPTPKKKQNIASTVASLISPNTSKVTVEGHLTPSKQEVLPSKSPNKTKRTPKKLFDRSPSDLNKFNVQVLADFVKVTPSKSSIDQTDDDVIVVSSTERKQSSILKFLSPVASNSSQQAKKLNECTPKKTILNECISPTERIKTKLDFTDCVKTGRTTPKKITPTKHKEIEDDFGLNEVCLDFDDDWGEDMMKDLEEYNLDLSESHHCKIISITPFPTKNVLTLKSTKTGEKAICNLQGFWIHTVLSIGDTVYVTAKKSDQEWVLDNDAGLLVYEPDFLISTTSVVNSLWCKRKCVLTERFKGFEPSNQQMLVGTLVHSLLQHVLRKKLISESQMVAAVQNLIKEKSIIKNAYECGITLQTIEAEVMKFVPKIEQFISFYLKNSKVNSNRVKNKDDWKGTIKSVDDIEENIWCPELGVKGKVDVSVRTDDCSMPLELKTGRATMSLEHRGQVMLYVMMMKKMGYDVSTGLLLYLREGVLREIPITQKEKRDIMLLRNDLAYYLTRPPKISEKNGEEKCLLPPELPEPINHPGCLKCPYNVICTSYAKYSNEDLSNYKTLKSIQNDVTKQLTDSHLNYIMKWITLSAMEANSDKQSKDVREIYTVTPQERESNGKCIINLKVASIADERDGVFEHSFEKTKACNFFGNGITESSYVVVSTDNRPAVACGFVTNLTATTISVSLDRNLSEKYSNKTFHIDSYDSSFTQSYNLASLTLLLDMGARGGELRGIIIDKKPPTFKQLLPKSIGTKGREILRKLNVTQQRAVLRAIAANEYFLIKGMPGTGKTSTIVALIQLLYLLEKTVLITSHTHSAVDNVCAKLSDCGVKMMRLGSELRMDDKLRGFSEHALTKHCETPEALAEVYNGTRVVAVTCLGSGHPLLSKRKFDFCVVDESTQVVQSSVIRPLHAAETFVLIGDPDQLPAVIRNNEAKELGMAESLFERLYREDAVTTLNLNYRMNSRITEIANGFTYKGELLVGNDSVANATLKLENDAVVSGGPQWVALALDGSLENSVTILDTGPVWGLPHKVSWQLNKIDTASDQNENDYGVNIYETAIAIRLINVLLKAGVPPKDIGVIATYRRQVAQISALIQTERLDISTVDQFQGKDKSVIIYSCGKSRDTSKGGAVDKFELLEDHKRVNVALTRSKHKLVMIGDVQTLKQYSTFKKLLPILRGNVIRLCESRDFQWDSILDLGVE